jgi:hypothetical protein
MADPTDPPQPQSPPPAPPDERRSAIAPDLLASIDAEFAELERELAALEKLPEGGVGAGDPTGVVQTLQLLHTEWSKRIAEKPDKPVWQRRLDEVLQRALGRILRAGQTIDAHGNLGFKLDNNAINAVLPDVAAEAQKGLEQSFIEKWTKPAGPNAGKPTVDASDLAAIVTTLMSGKKKRP